MGSSAVVAFEQVIALVSGSRTADAPAQMRCPVRTAVEAVGRSRQSQSRSHPFEVVEAEVGVEEVVAAAASVGMGSCHPVESHSAEGHSCLAGTQKAAVVVERNLSVAVEILAAP